MSLSHSQGHRKVNQRHPQQPPRRISTPLTVPVKIFGILLLIAVPLSLVALRNSREDAVSLTVRSAVAFALLNLILLNLSDVWAGRECLILRRGFRRREVPYALVRNVHALGSARMPFALWAVLTFRAEAGCGKWAVFLLQPRLGSGHHPDVEFLRSKLGEQREEFQEKVHP